MTHTLTIIYKMTVERCEAEKLLVKHYLTGGGSTYIENKQFIRGGSKFTEILSKIGDVAMGMFASPFSSPF